MSNEPQTIYDTAKLKAALKTGRHGYWLDHNDVASLFGREGGWHLPDEGFEIVHNGVTIKCDPKPEPEMVRDYWSSRMRPRKSSKHRVHYFCACCKWVPLGRAHQHLPACEAGDATV